MRPSPGAALDRQIEAVILTFARRDRPLLRLVPTALLRPVAAPTALRLRRSIVRGTLVIGIPAAAVLALWLGPGVASAASPSAAAQALVGTYLNVGHHPKPCHGLVAQRVSVVVPWSW